MKIDLLNSPARSIPLSENDVHMWLLKDQLVSDDNILQQYWGVLDLLERKKHAAFCFAKLRHQYLITRGLLRHILSLYEQNISPLEWRFKTNSYGKPHISNTGLTSPLYFNLSHTENMVALAVSRSEKIGIDVEWMCRGGNRELQLAEKYFSPLERRELNALPEAERKERFFSLWTLKEAYIKACGKGLSIPLDVFSFSISGQRLSIDFTDNYQDDPKSWSFWQFLPYRDYSLSLAKAETVAGYDSCRLNINEVVNGQNAISIAMHVVARCQAACTSTSHSFSTI